MSSDANVISYLEAGVRAEGLRQKAIANNVANMNTPGYRRYDLDFETVLGKAIEAQKTGQKMDLEPEFFQPKDTPLKANGNDVSLDNEVGAMVENSLRHQTFMLLLKKKYEQMKAAIQV